MAERDGFFLLWRRFFDHRYWREPRVFSRAEAWIDFIGLASYEDHDVVLGGQTVRLDRGQLVASVRMLADRWKWSKSKVHRWIEDGKSVNEIRDSGETVSGTRYAVVNYDTYQNPWDSNRDAKRDSDGTATGQRRDKTKEGKEGKEGESLGAKRETWETWKPNEGHSGIAKAEGLNVKGEEQMFRDHFIGLGKPLKSRDAAFRNWLRRANQYNRNSRKQEQGQYDLDAVVGKIPRRSA